MPSLEADSLLAITGLFPAKVELRELGAAQTLPETFFARIDRWMGAKQAEFTYYETPDLEKLWLDLGPPTQPEIAAWLRVLVDYPQAVDWITQLQAARQYMRAVWPKNVLQTFGGPQVLPLSPDDALEVASIFAVLDDPVRILDELDSYTLMPSQVMAFAAVYPELYAWAQKVVTEAAARRLAKDLTWSPTQEQELVMRIFDQLPPEPLPQFTAAPPAQPPKGDAVEEAVEGAKTQADRSGKPRSAGK